MNEFISMGLYLGSSVPHALIGGGRRKGKRKKSKL